MYVKKALLFTIIISLCFCFVDMEISKISADEDGLYALCNKLGSFKRYESKRIGYDDTISNLWEAGYLIVAYGDDAIPYLIDIYKESNSIIAQLFAARLVGEIDFAKGVKLLKNFENDDRMVDTIFGTQRSVMTVGDLVRKELIILERQEKKIESTIDHVKAVISSKED